MPRPARPADLCGWASSRVHATHQPGDQTILRLIRSRQVALVVSTITGGAGRMREGVEIYDGFQIRRAAVESGVPCLTSLDTARALVETLRDDGAYDVRPYVEYRQPR